MHFLLRIISHESYLVWLPGKFILYLKILSKSRDPPLTFFAAQLLLNFISLMLKSLSSPVHITKGSVIKASVPTAQTEKALSDFSRACSKAPVWKISLSDKRKTGKKTTDHSKFSIPGKSLIVS